MAAPVPLFDQFAIIALSNAPNEAPRPTVHVSIHPAGAVVFASSIEGFCFPDAGLPQTSNAGAESDFYVFVLTNADRERQLGFCRRIYPRVGAPAPRHPIVLCFLSRNHWFAMWSNLLQSIEDVFQVRGIDGILDVVDELQSLPLPLPSGKLLSEPVMADSPLQGLMKMADKFVRPPHGEPPVGDLDARPLFQSLSVAGVVQVMCNLLSERRVIFVSASIARLSACVHAAAALIYPFGWQHVFVPVVPHPLLSYCCAPMPFVVGILKPYLAEVKQMPLEEVSIINLDSDMVEVSIEDVGILPSELVSPLQTRLDRIVANWKRTGIWEARELMRSFLSFFVGIFGTYRRFFQQLPDGSAKFDRDAFCSAQGPRIQKFLEAFSQVQMFEVFLHEREKQGNQNAPPQTEFERQAYLHDVTTRGPTTKDKLMETTRTAMTSTRNAAKTFLGGFFVKEDASNNSNASQPVVLATPERHASHSQPPPASSTYSGGGSYGSATSGVKSYGTLSKPAGGAPASAKRNASPVPSTIPQAQGSFYTPPAYTPSPLHSDHANSSPNLFAPSTSAPPPLPNRSSTPSTYNNPGSAPPLSAQPGKSPTPPLPAPPVAYVPGPASYEPPPPPMLPPRPARGRAPSDLIEFSGSPARAAGLPYQPQVIPAAAQPPPFAFEFKSAVQVDSFSPRKEQAPPVLPPRPPYGLTEADLSGLALPSTPAHQLAVNNADPFALFASEPTEDAKLSSLPYETL